MTITSFLHYLMIFKTQRENKIKQQNLQKKKKLFKKAEPSILAC